MTRSLLSIFIFIGFFFKFNSLLKNKQNNNTLQCISEIKNISAHKTTSYFLSSENKNKFQEKKINETTNTKDKFSHNINEKHQPSLQKTTEIKLDANNINNENFGFRYNYNF